MLLKVSVRCVSTVSGFYYKFATGATNRGCFSGVLYLPKESWRGVEFLVTVFLLCSLCVFNDLKMVSMAFLEIRRSQVPVATLIRSPVDSNIYTTET